MIHIGIDPGKVGAAVAMDEQGEVLGAVYWTDKRAWRLDVDTSGALVWVQRPKPSMVDALAGMIASIGHVHNVALNVEGVSVNKGKGSPLVLATQAGIAIGVVSALCRVGSLSRPRPEHWRKVFTGRGLNGKRAELKAVALAWAAGRTYPGLHDLRLHPGGRVLPDGPDHAAEAAAMAWASVRGVV
jgi:hypothetical protein